MCIYIYMYYISIDFDLGLHIVWFEKETLIT